MQPTGIPPVAPRSRNVYIGVRKRDNQIRARKKFR